MLSRQYTLVILFLISCSSTNISNTVTVPQSGLVYKTVHSFSYREGIHPTASLLDGQDGYLYGTLSQGGANAGWDGTHDCGSNFYVGSDIQSYHCPGSLYRIALPGTEIIGTGSTGDGFTTLRSFMPIDDVTKRNDNGYQPYASLVNGPDAEIYGVTAYGGRPIQYNTEGCGTFFRLKPYDVKHSFCTYERYTDGQSPKGGLTSVGESFYGVASGGYYNTGVVYSIDTDGTVTNLHSFDRAEANRNGDGLNPYGTLILGQDGMLYGMTSFGGFNGYGTIYRLNLDGSAFSKLYDFLEYLSPITVDKPSSNALVLAPDGNLYGFVPGGSNGTGQIIKVSEGVVSTLYNFPYVLVTSWPRFANSDGAFPLATLLVAQDGYLYGTTWTGGFYGVGTIFRIKIDGSDFSVVKNFTSIEGANPCAGLIQLSNGKMYGTTYAGGAYGFGTIFSLESI